MENVVLSTEVMGAGASILREIKTWVITFHLPALCMSNSFYSKVENI